MAPSMDVMPAPSSILPSGENADADGTQPPVSSRQQAPKRNRIQLSCTHCRISKLKCDREKPCSQCVKKGRASLCSFPEPLKRKKPAVSMHNRLKHLESLVKGVMTGQSPDGSSDSTKDTQKSTLPGVTSQHQSLSEADEPLDGGFKSASHQDDHHPSGQVVIGPSESMYVGATHWAAILDDIEEVKSYFNENEVEDMPPDESVRPDTSLLFNSQSAATKEDLLAALPERNIVDRLVYRYFNSSSPALQIIHKPTFQKEYKKFWADPQGTPVSWLGMLYSVMCLATFAALEAGEENPDTRGTAMEMIRAYRGFCAQSLVLANYPQPGPYTLETFLIYMEGEFVLTSDDQMNCYLMAGVAVRLAIRMGLHRDSDHVRGNISPCQGEMRRRVWHLLVQIDLLVSFHIGLPAMILAIQSDTRPPRNLADQDFDEDTIELPPSRPDTEMTPMSYTLCKGRICRVFGKVAEQANLLSLPHYDEVMELDRLLHQAFSKVPPFFRAIPLELSVTDSPQIIMQRISISLIFHKTRCVLHRKYLMKDKENHEFSTSKRAGIDSAMELLYIQSEVHDAVQPGGPLCKDLWFVSSLSMHDFLLAAMIVYLSIFQESETVGEPASLPHEPATQREEMIGALERSSKIWAQGKSKSIDSRRASEVLAIMVKRVKSVLGRGSRQAAVSSSAKNLGGDYGADFISGLSLNEPMMSTIPTGLFEPIDAGQFGGSDDTSPSSGLAMQLDMDSMTMPMDSLGAMIDTPTNFDWDLFDNHLRPQQVSDQTWPDLSFPDFNFANNYDYNL